MTRPTDSSHMDMRTKILELIDGTIKYMPDEILLQELRQEIEAMEDDTFNPDKIWNEDTFESNPFTPSP